MNTKYRVLIVDDQGRNVEPLYRKLFAGDAEFLWEMARSKKAFLDAALGSYDAVLLDVNLDGWNMPLGEAVSHVGTRSPIVLVSQRWDDPTTRARVREVLTLAKTAHFVQILILNDLGDSGNKERVAAIREQLKLAVARHRRQGLLQIGLNKPIHILHLSDPQYGDPGQDSWASLAEDEIAKVIGLVEPEIHFVAITGDITYQGHPSEFRTAEEKLKQFLMKLWPSMDDWRERLLLVPGNHDVNLRVAAADKVEFDFSKGKVTCNSAKKEHDHLNLALQPFRDFAARLTGDPGWTQSTELCWTSSSFYHLGIRFFLLNSVGGISCDDPKVASVSESAISHISSNYSDASPPFGIAFCHHGPPRSKRNQVEAIKNWPSVSKLLQSCGIRVLAHGHGHERAANRHSFGSTGDAQQKGRIMKNEFVRVMAPTTHLNKKKRPNKSYRGFNIITLYRSNGVVGRLEISTYKLQETTPTFEKRDEFHF